MAVDVWFNAVHFPFLMSRVNTANVHSLNLMESWMAEVRNVAGWRLSIAHLGHMGKTIISAIHRAWDRPLVRLVIKGIPTTYVIIGILDYLSLYYRTNWVQGIGRTALELLYIQLQDMSFSMDVVERMISWMVFHPIVILRPLLLLVLLAVPPAVIYLTHNMTFAAPGAIVYPVWWVAQHPTGATWFLLFVPFVWSCYYYCHADSRYVRWHEYAVRLVSSIGLIPTEDAASVAQPPTHASGRRRSVAETPAQ